MVSITRSIETLIDRWLDLRLADCHVIYKMNALTISMLADGTIRTDVIQIEINEENIRIQWRLMNKW